MSGRKQLEKVNRYRRWDEMSPVAGRSIRRYFALPRRPDKGPPVVVYSPARIQWLAATDGGREA